MERALLVTIDFKEKDVSLSIEEEALELEGLSLACNVEVIDNLVVFAINLPRIFSLEEVK